MRPARGGEEVRDPGARRSRATRSAEPPRAGRATIVVVLLCAACGFAPQDSFTGRRIGDGISPWKDLGAIELCLGNDRIGPAGSEVGGLCVAGDAPPDTTCLADADCRSREMCVCGRCTLKYCSVASECGDTRVCAFSEKRCLPTCIVDADCVGAGEFCAGGVCKARCTATAECQTGEICNSSGRCTIAPCSVATDCRAGEACREQRMPRATTEPSPLADGTRIVLYLEMADPTGAARQIWRASSADGRLFAFDPPQPVIAAGGAPSLVRMGAGYRVYFETPEGISSADSSDGRSFGDASLVIPGDYHAPGAAVLPSGGVYVYVAEGDRGGLALWDGGGAPRPVLTPADVTDPVMWRNVDRVGSPFALVATSPLGQPAVHVWFDAFGQESADSIQFGTPTPIPPNDSVGFASTLMAQPDRLIRYAENPVFDRVQALLDHRAERAPAVLQIGDEAYLLYYVGASADGTQAEGIGVAKNPAE